MIQLAKCDKNYIHHSYQLDMFDTPSTHEVFFKKEGVLNEFQNQQKALKQSIIDLENMQYQ